MQGRLQGKRLHAPFFMAEVAKHGTEACAYLLAVDVELNTVDGFALASWEGGYGDFVLVPDPASLRILPWQERTALVLADVTWPDGTVVAPSPRQVLRRQLARAAERDWTAYVGTELEFIVFEDTYEQAWDTAYRGLTPANRYNVDYSVLGTSRIEPLLRDIRLGMAGAGMTVESAKGECNPGQHEIAFRYTDALTTCDQHVVYKTGAKEIAAAHGRSLTFMAKPNEREGNSCHVHLSFQDGGGDPVMTGAGPHGLSPVGGHLIAGLLAGLRELTLLLAPNVNSYKRFVGGDVNPYLAVAALVAAALDGAEHELPLPAPVTGNAYTAGPDVPRVPATLDEAARLWSASALAREAFGQEVVDHYANMARVEVAASQAAVTDWELRRYFERI